MHRLAWFGGACLVWVGACTLDFDTYRGAGTGGAATSTTAATGGSGGTMAPAGPGVGGSAGGMGAQGGGGASSAGGNGAGGSDPLCPGTQPTPQSGCTEIGAFCAYEGGDVQCECWEGEWSCDSCPTTAPSDNDSCNGFNFSRCDYGSSQCFCFQGDWNCGSCPAAPQVDMGDCSGLGGLHCAYGATECACFFNEWDCQ